MVPPVSPMPRTTTSCNWTSGSRILLGMLAHAVSNAAPARIRPWLILLRIARPRVGDVGNMDEGRGMREAGRGSRDDSITTHDARLSTLDSRLTTHDSPAPPTT